MPREAGEDKGLPAIQGGAAATAGLRPDLILDPPASTIRVRRVTEGGTELETRRGRQRPTISIPAGRYRRERPEAPHEDS